MSSVETETDHETPPADLRPFRERVGEEVVGGIAFRLGGEMHACDVALVASGTATLEAALFKRPMVIAYNMHWLSWQMMKRMKYQPGVGLPNILLRDFAVPELLQDEATPAKLADAALAWLADPARCDTLVQRFQALHRELRCNTALAATDAIEKILAA